MKVGQLVGKYVSKQENEEVRERTINLLETMCNTVR